MPLIITFSCGKKKVSDVETDLSLISLANQYLLKRSQNVGPVQPTTLRSYYTQNIISTNLVWVGSFTTFLFSFSSSLMFTCSYKGNWIKVSQACDTHCLAAKKCRRHKDISLQTLTHKLQILCAAAYYMNSISRQLNVRIETKRIAFLYSS